MCDFAAWLYVAGSGGALSSSPCQLSSPVLLVLPHETYRARRCHPLRLLNSFGATLSEEPPEENWRWEGVKGATAWHGWATLCPLMAPRNTLVQRDLGVPCIRVPEAAARKILAAPTSWTVLVKPRENRQPFSARRQPLCTPYGHQRRSCPWC